MSTDMATLTGAYAVNALPDEERTEFELHLAVCDDCRQEVSELREAAARLGGTAEAPPPETLKQRVLEEIARTRQDPPPPGDVPVTPLRAPKRRSWGMRLTAAAAVLGVVLAAIFGTFALRTQQELADVRHRMERTDERGVEMAQVLQASDARTIHAGGPGEMRATTVISQQEGMAMFMPSGVTEPPPERTYQLWFIGPSGMSSAGVFSGGPDRTDPLVAAMPEGTAQLGVTIEPAGGSPQPTTDPIMMVPVPT